MGSAALPLALVSGAAGMASSFGTNRAIRASSGAARNAAAVQRRQADEQTRFQRFDVSRRADRVAGRLRVAAASQGTDVPSLAGLVFTNEFERSLNLARIDRNRDNTFAAIDSNLNTTLASNQVQRSNPFLSGFSAALGGFTTGLQIDQMNRSGSTE